MSLEKIEYPYRLRAVFKPDGTVDFAEITMRVIVKEGDVTLSDTDSHVKVVTGEALNKELQDILAKFEPIWEQEEAARVKHAEDLVAGRLGQRGR